MNEVMSAAGYASVPQTPAAAVHVSASGLSSEYGKHPVADATGRDVSASGLWAIIGGWRHRMFVLGPSAFAGANQARQLRFRPAADTSLPVASAQWYLF
jgi:hypothetical protein